MVVNLHPNFSTNMPHKTPQICIMLICRVPNQIVKKCPKIETMKSTCGPQGGVLSHAKNMFHSLLETAHPQM